MDYLLKKFLPRIEFDSYEDFKANYTVNVPENFNFGFDVVDAWAEEEPEKKALVWCDEEDNEKIFTFTDIKRLSNKAANFFKSLGVKKGSVVMLILRRRWEYWVCATALHKLGAILIPGTLQLTKKDIVYRGNAAQVCAVVCVNDPFVIEQVEAAQPDIPSLQNKILVAEQREGWLDLNEELEKFPDTFPAPPARRPPAGTTLCWCTSPLAPRACPRWCSTTSPTPWGTLSPPSTGSRWRRTSCT